MRTPLLTTLSSLLVASSLSGCVFDLESDCSEGFLFDIDGFSFGCEEEQDAWGDNSDEILPCEALTNGYCDGDQDTIPDEIEGMIDTDGDGAADCEDPDSDNDGILDKDECGENPWNPIDTDGDGAEDFRDSDADNDTIPDEVEGGVDSDGDGDEDQVDLDSDNDGIDDEDECGEDSENPVDTDGDGLEDFVDEDSDDDGIDDAVEGDGDTDGDGIPDNLDEDSDDDGFSDAEEGESDSDGDGIPDFLDFDEQDEEGDDLDGDEQGDDELLGSSAPECGGCQGTVTASGSLAMALLLGLPMGLMRNRKSWEGGN